MNFYLFAALLTGAAAALASMAVRLVLKGKARDTVSLVVIAGIVALGATSGIPRAIHSRLFGQEELERQIVSAIIEKQIDWMFEDRADIERFARQVVLEAGNDRSRLKTDLARMVGEKTRTQMRYLHDSDIRYVTELIDGAKAMLQYFIDNAQFGNCRTFLLGGYDYPGADDAVMSALIPLLREAVQSGKRGEKNWTKVGEGERDAYNARSLDHLRSIGYTDDQIQATTRIDTTVPAEMESNCRITYEIFAHQLAEYPPEVSATAYLSAY